MITLSQAPADQDVVEHVELARDGAVEVDQDARTITGLILPYGVLARRTSVGQLMFQAGSLHHHPDLGRIKLLIDHDGKRSVGYCTALEQSTDGVTATFHVPEGAEGDAALAQAANGVRDGLSVGADILMMHKAADGSHSVVTKGYLQETSLVALPAFGDARVTTVHASQHNEGDTMDEDETTETPTEAPAPAPAAPVATVQASTQPTTIGQVLASQPQQPYPATPAPGTTDALQQAAETVAAVVRSGGGAVEVRAALASVPGAVTAALSDVIPANDAGQGFIGRPGFLGELWKARRTGRPVMDGFGPVAALTKLKEVGWQWTTKPEVDTYAGNKAEIPSNEVRTDPVEVTAERTAGGWDVDRIYLDLGDADMVAALFQAAMEDYAVKSEAWALAKVKASGTTVAAQASLNAALIALGVEAGKIGASLGLVVFAPDVWSTFLTLTRNELPWWMNPGASVDIVEGTVQLGPLRLASDPDLAAGEVLAADRRAVTFKEASHRVQAIDLPRGGVDLGVFAYHSGRINDTRAIWKTSVTAPVGG